MQPSAGNNENGQPADFSNNSMLNPSGRLPEGDASLAPNNNEEEKDDPQIQNDENQDPNISPQRDQEEAKASAHLSALKSRYQLHDTQNLLGLQRSYQFSNNDRFAQEQAIMLPLKAGGGLMGTSRIILEEKVAQLNLDQSKVMSDSQILEKLRMDGVYVDDPQVHQKFTDINVQKLEERLLRENKTNYFKMNGELKLHNDLLADEITRPADQAFEQSEAYQQKEINAILSDRMHSFKKRYYRLDIVVGKMSLLRCPSVFSAEDRLAIELKELYKDYERRTSLAMIPFYMSRLEFIEEQQYIKGKHPHTPSEELEFLKQNRDEAQRKLDQEKREVQDQASLLYNKWKQIKDLRQSQNYSCSNVKLKIHENKEIGDYYFNLMHEKPSAKKFDGSALPGSEITRRNDANKIRAYVRLIINGQYVSRTKKVFLSWPNFEIEVMEQFQVHVFTMPSSIQLEIVIGMFKEVLVDVIDVEVPGSHVKALTSASSMVKEIEFSKYNYDQKRLTKKYQMQSTKPEGELSLKQKTKLEAEKKRKQALDNKAQENDTRGYIYLKSEWKGEGPEMPPMKSENLFKNAKISKERKNYSEDEQTRMILRQLYIDVNDPRNEQIIKLIKETKNEFLIHLLNEDSKNPLASLQSFRHKLMNARTKDPVMSKVPIPLLEREIIDYGRSKFFLDQLEVLFREEAYKEYLDKRAQLEKIEQAENDPRAIQLAEFLNFDTESIRRRQKFFDLLKQKQKEIKAGHQRASTQYKSIVREFEMLENDNALVALFNKMFVSGRKLKPLVRKRQAVALDTCKDAKIMVHVIKGYHVPVRSNVFKQVNQLKQVSATMDPYGRNVARPTARTPQSMLMQQSGYPGMGGGTGSMEMMRQSYGGGQGNFMGSGMPQMYSGFGSNSYGGGPNMMSGLGGMGNMQAPMSRQVGGDITDYNRKAIMQMKDLYKIARVETFVEIRVVYNDFFSEVKTTNIAEGDFPEWNEVLDFSLQSENGKKFTKEELINSQTLLYISLFDREITPYKEDDFSSTQIKMQIEYRYLGSFSVPLTSILNNPPKMEAMFKVNRPLALFNYVILKDNIFLMDENERRSQEQRTNEELNTYISLSISLDPVLELPTDNELEYYPGAESSALLLAASEWVKRLKHKKKFAQRQYQMLGENIQGHSLLLCRFLTEQAPPDDVCDLERYRNDEFAIEKTARYVSLIPYIEDNKAFQDMPELFCTSQEFLDLGAGDYEEHAILLCNFFNYIDKIQTKGKVQSYLVLGKGTPEGKTAYVLRRDIETNHVELWNPMKGESYFFGRKELVDKVGCLSIGKGYMMDIRINDPACQLKSLDTIISSDNVWLNVQNVEDPSLINYDLNQSKLWQPFFTKSNMTKYFPGNQIMTVQPPLSYSQPQINDEELAIRIQKYISQKFQDERIKDVKMTTKWNVAVGEKLNNILFQCELFKMKARQGGTSSSLRTASRQNANEDLDVSAISEKIRKATEDDAHGKRAWGFPINVTFITLDLLWEEVKNTKLHAIMDRNAEFSLSVWVKPYSNNVLSVWLYVAAFTKQKLNI